MSEAQAAPATESKPVENNSSIDVEKIKAELEKTRQELDGFKQKEKTLAERVREENDKKDKDTSAAKDLEKALTFTLTCKDFVKSNESVLPKDMAAVIQAAEKESYDSAINKANVIKSELVQMFFNQQSNLDLLTDGQKSDLAEFQKLTKNGREAKASEIYRNIFEPALESLKRVKKAEELNRVHSGFGASTDADQAYKEKLSQMAQKKFFRGKN